MKLLFKKNEKHEISVLQRIDNQEKEFTYVDMVKFLIQSRKLDTPETSKGFTEAETVSINRMVELINKELSAVEEPEQAHPGKC